METQVKQNILERVVEAVKDILNPQPDSAFTVQKDLNGEYRWIATFSNRFKDRDGEIISEKAWDGYIDRVNSGLVPMPELWMGHIDGTKHGQADMIFGIGDFVNAVGHFDSPEIGKQAADYARKHGNKTSLSHGFTFPTWGFKDGIYEVINTFEISVLPPPLVASNPFTEFEVKDMKQITPDQEAAMALYWGKDKTNSFIESRLQQSEEIKAAGVAFKDFAEVPATETPAVEIEAAPQVDAVKPLADLIATLLEDMGELVAVQAAQGKALKSVMESSATKEAATVTEKAALAAEVATLKAQVEKLTAELALTPVRASEAKATQVSAEKAAEILGHPAQETDSFWKA
jgi:hypothetical protein